MYGYYNYRTDSVALARSPGMQYKSDLTTYLGFVVFHKNE